MEQSLLKLRLVTAVHSHGGRRAEAGLGMGRRHRGRRGLNAHRMVVGIQICRH